MSILDLKVRIGGNTKDFDSAMKNMQKSFDRSVRKMQRTGQTLTRNLTVPIATMAAGAVTAAVDFEDAFAGVRKTVDATEAEFQGLRKGILDMTKTMPTAAGEIAEVAEAAGQLGIRTDNILEFSKTMVQLGDTTNLTAQQAATSLARIANVMQIPQDRFDEMGSTIVGLGNNFATTEAEIVDMAQRISGAGKIAGFAASDIFGLSTALSSVGVAAESGGTAAQKGILAINDAVARGGEKLQVFAETAGMTASQFRDYWKEDAAGAFTAFVNGLGMQGDKATVTLSDVGLNSERTRAAFLSLANAGNLLNDTLEMGADEWDKNNALTEEAQKKYKTIASRLKTLYNRIYALGVSIGDALMPAVDKAITFVSNLTDAFDKLSSEAKIKILSIVALLAAGGPLLLAFTGAIKAVGILTAIFTSKFTLIAAAITGVVVVGQWFVDNWEKIQQGLSNVTQSIKIAFQKMGKGIMIALREVLNFVLTKIPPVAMAEFFGIDVTGWASEMTGIDGAINSLTSKIEQGRKDLESGISKYNKMDFGSFSESARRALQLTKNTIAKGLKGIIADTEIEELLNKLDQKLSQGGSEGAPGGSSADKVMGISVASVAKIKEAVMGLNKVDLSKMRVEFNKTQTKWKQFKDKFKDIGGEFKAFLANEVSSAVLSFGDAIGKSLAGADSQWKTTFEKITLVILDFAESLARLAAGIGAVMLFIPGFQGMGGGLLAAAAALQAISSGFRASIEKKARRREANATSSTNFSSMTAPQRPNYSAVAMPSSGAANAGVINNVINLDGRKIYEGMQRYRDRIS